MKNGFEKKNDINMMKIYHVQGKFREFSFLFHRREIFSDFSRQILGYNKNELEEDSNEALPSHYAYELNC